MTFEICTDSFEGALAATKYDVKRIELCSALSVGGLTPSYGLIKQCEALDKLSLQVMIRPKPGGFQYNASDIKIMMADIKASKKLGAQGVVFGILDAHNNISPSNQTLIDLAKSLDLETTFHRAFDFVTDYHKAINQLITFGFDRVLTSGLQPTAEAGFSIISELQAFYGTKIQIMAGSGVNAKNALKFAESGINQLHFTAHKQGEIPLPLGMGFETIVDEAKIESIVRQFS
jgi:copper homeostasis protein